MTAIPRHGLRPAPKGLGHGLGQVSGLCHASVSPKWEGGQAVRSYQRELGHWGWLGGSAK